MTQRFLCHMLCHHTLWSIVECSNHTPIENFISTIQIEQIRCVCVANLSLMNFGIFRAVVKLLGELQYLCPMSIPNDSVNRLQTRLKDIYYRPGNSTLKKSSFVPLSGKAFVLNTGSKVSSDIVRFLHSSARSSSSWINLLFQDGYFKTLIGLTFATTIFTPAVTSLRFIVQNVWDELPTGKFQFQFELRSAARSMMRSNNILDIIDQYALVIFITRGIQLNSYTCMHDYYCYSLTDKTNCLSCNCLAKLLIEVICEGHSKDHYQDNILLHIGETFAIDCFRRRHNFERSGEEQWGVAAPSHN